MRILILVFQMVINLNLYKVSSKKYISASDESIENLLYYKDCKHKDKSTIGPPVMLRNVEPPPPREPDCPFPKMCCSMSCGNDCGSQPSLLGRQMEPLQNLQPIQSTAPLPGQPGQPQMMKGRRKKLKQPQMQPLIGGRRGFGFTKDKIKSLISHDADIRKILKDLVRVTMQKVDLLEMVNARRSNTAKNSDTSLNSEADDN